MVLVVHLTYQNRKIGIELFKGIMAHCTLQIKDNGALSVCESEAKQDGHCQTLWDKQKPS